MCAHDCGGPEDHRPLAIDGAEHHVCALQPSGAVSCFGRNDIGQLGNGVTHGSSSPSAVVGIDDAVSVATTMFASCAARADGSVWCWGGAAGWGESFGPTPQPVPIVATRLAAGGTELCALSAEGAVDCWEPRKPHEARRVFEGAVDLAVGRRHVCAVLHSGEVWCRGSNEVGQLGDGSAVDSEMPVRVADVGDARAIVSGGSFTCALRGAEGEPGRVSCWGYNSDGQLGDGSRTDRPTPVDVLELDGVVALAAGWRHACGLRADASVACWGDNGAGQLGDGTEADATVPVEVATLPPASAIGAGWWGTCAAIAGGGLRCWGINNQGQLGDGAIAMTAMPVPVAGLEGASEVVARGSQTCALRVDGTAACWGYPTKPGGVDWVPSNTPLSLPLNGVRSLAPGAVHACAVLDDGTVRCWGDNTLGEFGDGTHIASKQPVQAVGLANATHVTTGHGFSCAIASSEVWCWGQGGGLGDGPSSHTPAPMGFAALDIAAADRHVCALMQDGTVRCWGSTDFGPYGGGLGAGAGEPFTVLGVEGATAIASGAMHTCAIVEGGHVVCWGLMDNPSSPTTNVDAHVIHGVTDAVALAAGWFRTCAVVAGGHVRCWGEGSSGQLGAGYVDHSPSALEVTGITHAVDVAVGESQSCAALDDRTAQCWGSNLAFALGTGTPTHASVPVPVVGF